jgi:crossover junction endodeoxyribonuclease RuvC
MNHIGIDPGKSGCMAAIGPEVKGGVQYSPKLGSLNEKEIFWWIFQFTPAVCVLERVRSSPQMGVTSAFTFGRGYGTLLGVLGATEIPLVEVTPQKWQKALGCMTGGDKNVTKRKAQQLFPELRVTHVNADALLLAKFCQQNAGDLF